MTAQRQVSAAWGPTKIHTDCFLLNHPFNAKCIPIKRQPHLSPAVLATLCRKGNSVIILLQSTMLCVYTNSNRGIEIF